MTDKEKYVMICPKCGSKNVGPDYSLAGLFFGGPITHKMCYHCRYIATSFPKVPQNKVPKKPKKVK